MTLAPNLTEMVAHLGCGDRLVGTDDYSDFPVAVRSLGKVGGAEPSLEAIVALRPDLVILSTSGGHPALRRSLERVSIRSMALQTDRLKDVGESMDRLRKQLGPCRGPSGDFLTRLEAQRRKRSHAPRVLFLVWPSPLYIAGRETFIDDLIVLTGGVTAVDESVRGWPQYSPERIVSEPPDVVLFPRQSVTESQARGVAGRSRGTLFAGVDEDVFTRPGPRLAQAAAELNAILDRYEAQR